MKLTVGKKLELGFGAILALMLFTAVLGCYKISVSQRYANTILATRYPIQLHNGVLHYFNAFSMSKEREYFLLADDPVVIKRIRSNWDTAWKGMYDESEALQTLAAQGSQEDRADVAEIRSHLAELRNIQASCLEVRKPGQPDTVMAAVRCMSEANGVGDKIGAAITRIDFRSNKLIEQEKDSLTKANRELYQALIWSTVLALAFGSFIAWKLSHKIKEAIQEVLTRAEAIAACDLSGSELEARSEDEIGDLVRAVNTMQGKLADMLQEVSSSAQQLAANSGRISDTVEQQSQGAMMQRDQVQQMASAMHEMAVTVEEISGHSQAAAHASHKATDTARDGGKVMDQTLHLMRVITNSENETAGRIQDLGKSSERIGKIIGVIDEIAEQTNLLALNAAIEAARAGEQGRGFAVVAGEVRKLAERTGGATKEITAMIQEIQKETVHAVEAMQAGTQNVALGVDSTQHAGKSLEEIISDSDKVGEMITHIATAATQQASATQELHHSVEHISAFTTETAKGAEQSAHACHELSALAVKLNSLVGQFNLEKRR